VQFIGGEPTLNRNLPDFIARARSLDYEFVEVFTNLIRLPSPLLDCFVANEVHVATSAYSNDPRVHDEITKKPGSFRQTMRNIDTVLAAGLPLRAGVITMPLNENHVDDTISFLRAKGVEDVGTDRVRDFGRASADAAGESMSNLCGKCAGSTLCVSPGGGVSPCIMSKTWSIGSMLETPLADLVRSRRLGDLRRQIFEEAGAPREQAEAQANCEPSCPPSCYPSCVPACAPSCAPSCVPSCAPSCFPSCGPACGPSR
jgi:sulfatase maturation enzyme AslB (radical SAM superfamily)